MPRFLLFWIENQQWPKPLNYKSVTEKKEKIKNGGRAPPEYDGSRLSHSCWSKSFSSRIPFSEDRESLGVRDSIVWTRILRDSCELKLDRSIEASGKMLALARFGAHVGQLGRSSIDAMVRGVSKPGLWGQGSAVRFELGFSRRSVREGRGSKLWWF
jgi:hypothetical protein